MDTTTLLNKVTEILNEFGNSNDVVIRKRVENIILSCRTSFSSNSVYNMVSEELKYLQSMLKANKLICLKRETYYTTNQKIRWNLNNTWLNIHCLLDVPLGGLVTVPDIVGKYSCSEGVYIEAFHENTFMYAIPVTSDNFGLPLPSLPQLLGVSTIRTNATFGLIVEGDHTLTSVIASGFFKLFTDAIIISCHGSAAYAIRKMISRLVRSENLKPLPLFYVGDCTTAGYLNGLKFKYEYGVMATLPMSTLDGIPFIAPQLKIIGLLPSQLTDEMLLRKEVFSGTDEKGILKLENLLLANSLHLEEERYEVHLFELKKVRLQLENYHYDRWKNVNWLCSEFLLENIPLAYIRQQK